MTTSDIHPRKVVYFAIAAGLFSILYWTAALGKGVHVDEFFSWVYAQRFSFWEVLQMKEFGIGHPPPFHLLQKIVQQLGIENHLVALRLLNFVVGILFLFVLTNILISSDAPPYLFLALSMSGVMLNTFVLARMWGLVCLFSALLLLTGERYLNSGKRKDFYLFLIVAMGGFLADFNFVLLLPYILMVLTTRSGRIKDTIYLLFSFLLLLWITTTVYFSYSAGVGLSQLIMKMIHQSEEVLYRFAVMVFQFRFMEFLLAGLSVIFIGAVSVRLFHSRKSFLSPGIIHSFAPVKRRLLSASSPDAPAPSNREEISPHTYNKRKRHTVVMSDFLLFMLLIIILEVLLKMGWLRLIQVIPIALVGLVWFYLRFKKMMPLSISSPEVRLTLTFLGGSWLLLWAHQFFWRDLLIARFLVLLLPFVLLLFYRYLAKPVQFIVAVVMVVSGILFLFSASLEDNYPAPYTRGKQPIIYQNAFAYATDYFYSRTEHGEPYMLDFTPFDKFCRICRTGSADIPYQQMDSVWVVYRSGKRPITGIPPSFLMKSGKETNLTRLDNFGFKHLTPVYQRRYAIFKFVRKR